MIELEEAITSVEIELDKKSWATVKAHARLGAAIKELGKKVSENEGLHSENERTEFILSVFRAIHGAS